MTHIYVNGRRYEVSDEKMDKLFDLLDEECESYEPNYKGVRSIAYMNNWDIVKMLINCSSEDLIDIKSNVYEERRLTKAIPDDNRISASRMEEILHMADTILLTRWVGRE